jgi:peptide/nickel transport system permease protein
VSGSTWKRPSAIFGVAVVGLLTAARLAAFFVDVDPALPTDRPLLGPSVAHALGTDTLGRDLFARMIAATEAFYFPGLAAAATAIFAGVPAGAAVGYWPTSWASRALQGVLTMMDAWPRLVLVVVAVAIFTSSVHDPAAWADARLYVLGLLVGLSWVPAVAGAVSEKVQHFRRERFVEAARAHGIADGAILGYHILWANCRDPVLRQACTVFGAFLLVETSLSYLGHYGVPAPRPSWGNILADLRFAIVRSRGLMQDADSLRGAIQAAVEQGALLGVVAPTLAIALSMAGVLALADHFGRREAL